MLHLSVISPVYNSANLVEELARRIMESVSSITGDYELILVDDGSTDDSWLAIEKACEGNKNISGIKLSRNFGQHYAISAGLDHSSGEWVVVTDCDLQDRPEEIVKLYTRAQEGFDIVLARRTVRNDSFFKRMCSAMFYRTLGYLTGTRQDEKVANFGIYSRKVIDAVISMREPIRYFPSMIRWVGFSYAAIDVIHDKSRGGRSRYSFRKLFRLGLDIILAYSDKPLRLVIKCGMAISFLAFAVAIVEFIRWLTGHIEVPGYTSLIISIWFLAGVIISTLGLVGLYVGKTFEGVKNRPAYIIEKSINDKKA